MKIIEWKMVKFDFAMTDVTAGNLKIQKKDYKKEGLFPVIDQGQSFTAGFTDDESFLYNGELPVLIFGDHTRIIKFVENEFCLGADGVRVLRPKKYFIPKFLYYYLSYKEVPNKGYSRHFKYLKEIIFPFPPQSEQQRIVEILEQADELRKKRIEADNKAERIIPALFHEMFGDLASNSSKWPLKKFSNLCTEKKQTISAREGEELPYIGLEDIESVSGRIHIKEGAADKKKVIGISFQFDSENILFGKLRPYLNKVALPNFSGRCSTELVPLLPVKGYTREYIASFLRSQYIVDSLMLKNKGAQMPRADMKYLMDLEVIDPRPELIEKFTELYKSYTITSDLSIKSKVKIEELFNVILSKAFSSELTASWREAHMKELLQEMEEQKKYLENNN